jgi:hypothetical protein
VRVKNDERVRRPPLDRTTPVRDWRSIVTVVPGTADGQAGQDVQNANRVMEEYLRAGEATARAFGRAMGGGDRRDTMPQIARTFTDLMAMYFEWLARAAGERGPSPAADRQAPAAAPSAADGTRTEPLRLSIAVESARPVTITIDLHAQTPAGALRVDRMYPRRGKAKPMTGIEIDHVTDSRRLVVRLRVDASQPAGVYDGVIVDESTSLPAGSLSVAVTAARKTPRRGSGARN